METRIAVVILCLASAGMPNGAGFVWPSAVETGVRISGSVFDVSGAVIPNTIVRLMGNDDDRVFAETKTDQKGLFLFTDVVPQRYRLRLEAPGFLPALRSIVAVPGEDLDIDDVVLQMVTPPDVIEIQAVSLREFRGRYRNIDYGYSVEIPNGLTGANGAAPAPNHGFTIHIGERSAVWVDASYEATPHHVGPLNDRLGKLRAERKTWNTTESGVTIFHEAIVARGYDRHTPILYTIQMDTTPSHRAEASPVFEALIRSFRSIPVRP